jgi:hypothetical protein
MDSGVRYHIFFRFETRVDSVRIGIRNQSLSDKGIDNRARQLSTPKAR